MTSHKNKEYVPMAVISLVLQIALTLLNVDENCTEPGGNSHLILVSVRMVLFSAVKNNENAVEHYSMISQEAEESYLT